MGNKNGKIQAYGKTVREERNLEIKKWEGILSLRKKELKISPDQEERIVKSYAH